MKKWIEVSKKMPKTGTPVLICYEKDGERYQAVAEWGSHSWSISCDHSYDLDELHTATITYWRELEFPSRWLKVMK